ncbi:MEI2-like 4 isoform X1 [Olea europaea subsp. europaea]|uniref:MEI2-like 4 isoform X1 n=2 Tax=Olea europaea subsp. europaea TaxID=158383 RepID=A0A8S0R8C5_OLEEU|nr:MEI2-like 4 isoform X1 [Olea europaea subsp. europaea]
MNPRGSSPSSFFSEDVRFHDERQVGLWKMDTMPGYYGLETGGALKSGGPDLSSLENRTPLDPQTGKGFDLPEYFQSHVQKVNNTLDKHIVGAERAASHSLPSGVDHDLSARFNSNAESASYILNGNRINVLGAQFENGLFSSSLSDLFSRKVRLSSNDASYGHSFGGGAASHYEAQEGSESLEELEAQTIGNLLPDDDDLLSGLTDGFGYIARPNKGGDMEDLDLFSSVGGLELGEDGPSQRNYEFSDVSSINQLGLSYGSNDQKHPSRTLFLRNINSNVEDSELRVLFEQYGEIRTLYTAWKHRGFVMISYYDIRAAQNAMKDLQSKPLRRTKFDIHFSFPKDNPSEKDNQGVLLVYNLDSSISIDELRQIFGVYGEIKEIQGTPNRGHQILIEFYDVRAAEAALRALNRSEIAGKQIKVEANITGGFERLMQPLCSELDQEESGLQVQQNSPPNNLTSVFSGPYPLGGITSSTNNRTILGSHLMNGHPISPLLDNMFHHGASSSVPNSLPSLVRMGSVGNQSSFGESGHSQGNLKFEIQGLSNSHPHSLPEYHDGLTNGPPTGSTSNMVRNISVRPPVILENQQFHRVSSNGQSIELDEGVFGSSGNGSCPPPGRHYLWSNSHHPQSQGIVWSNSPSFVNGIGAARPQQLHSVPRAPSHMLNAFMPINNHHVGSAPSANPALWDRRHAYAGESPDGTAFHPGSLANLMRSGSSPHPLEFIPHDIFPRTGGNYMDLPIPSKNIGLHTHHQRCMMFPTGGQMISMMSSFDSPTERNRGRRNEGSSSQSDNKKQFELDIDRIVCGEDKRTTLMIKNIPNKYTSKMLLAAIDERHRGTYDFIYLPIDFKNKCNVGYAFINMTDPTLIIPFYQTFNGKKWEKFNSEKVASLAYARIQGKAALIAHFQNSSLMNEDKRCRPILFHTDGPNAGDQVPFPMGTSIRPRPGKIRASTSEDFNQEVPLNGDEFSNGDSSSGSGKDSV